MYCYACRLVSHVFYIFSALSLVQRAAKIKGNNNYPPVFIQCFVSLDLASFKRALAIECLLKTMTNTSLFTTKIPPFRKVIF